MHRPAASRMPECRALAKPRRTGNPTQALRLCWGFARRGSMRNVRIYVELPLVVGDQLNLPAQAAEHVARVLRMAAGDAVTLFNGDGRDYHATILAAGKRDVLVSIGNARDAVSESPL